MRRSIGAVAIVLAAATGARAQAPDLPIDESVREQSCKSLQGGTAGVPDQAPAGPLGGTPATGPEAPAELLPSHVYLRTQTETFNRLYEFATRNGAIYVRARGAADKWRPMPLPSASTGAPRRSRSTTTR